jgi:probable phosphoglycerate mutase
MFMLARSNDQPLQFLLVRAGSTEFDEQGRIQGSLNVPLSDVGEKQAEQAAHELHDFEIKMIYSGPSQAAVQTAEHLSHHGSVKVKVDSRLQNIDFGLWHGKEIEEIRHNQPKLYRQWKESPEMICPPDGETVDEARIRFRGLLHKIIRKHKTGNIALVALEPMASIIRAEIRSSFLTSPEPSTNGRKAINGHRSDNHIDSEVESKSSDECGAWETLPARDQA